MSSRLDLIDNWEELAELAGFSVTRLAARCNTTPRHLERYFREKKDCQPHVWMEKLKMEKAKGVLIFHSVKEVGDLVGYAHANSFSRAFERIHGIRPRGKSRV